MNRYVLEMHDIRKSFDGVKVLENVSFCLEEGHVHALVGGNGAGKSTLMKILTGVYSPDSGIIKVHDRETRFHGYGDASRHGIRMIFQELSIIPTLTVAENIFLNQEKRKVGFFLDERLMFRKAKELLDKFGIQIDPKAVTNTLSVGCCQLVEIAKALSMDAKILIMDEPTASLSESEVGILFDLIKTLKEKMVSVVYISHRMNEILRIADEVTVLRDGKNVITEPARKLSIEAIITYIMGENVEKTFEWKDRRYTGDGAPLFEVKDLQVEHWIKNITFHVRKGEVLGIAGLMGSGRTEILQAIFGIRRPEKGEILLEGKPVKIRSVADAVKAKIALVPEDRRWQGLILSHTVKQNISLPILKQLKGLLFLDDRKTDVLVSESVSELNIKTDGIHKISRLLSGGNQQKVVLAKWLRTKPKVLLLDEPNAGIDVGAKGEIIDIIRKFSDSGNAVILVSSELSELLAVCDRILILSKGRILHEMSRKDIENEEVVQHAIQA